MSDKKEPVQFVMRVDVEETPYYGGSASRYLHARFLFMKLNAAGDDIESLGSWSWNDDEMQFADLQIDAQTDDDIERRGQTWYGWSLEYRQPWKVDLHRAEVMAKTMRRIDAKITEQSEFLGSAPDFVSYAMRIASVLKIRRFCRVRHYGAANQNREVIWMDPNAVRYYVDSQEREFKEKYAPANSQLHVVTQETVSEPEPVVEEAQS